MLDGAAADAERQGRPRARCPRPTQLRPSTARRYVGAAHAGRGGAGGHLGAKCSASSASASTTTSSTSAATRCSPRRSSRACAKRFGVELPLRAVFEAPTVAELAARVEARAAGRGRRRTRRPIAPRRARGRRCRSRSRSSASGSSTSSSRAAALYNIPAAVRLDGRLDVGGARAQRSTRSCAATRCCARRFADGGRAARCRSSPPAPAVDVPVDRPERLRRSGARGGSARGWPREEARAPFDLVARAAAARDACCGSPRTSTCCSLTMHHIVSDGWSMGVLVREVAALYEAFVEGEPSPLAGAAGPVRRLRALAARVAAGRGARSAARLLARAAGGRAARAGTADRPAAPARAELTAARAARFVLPPELSRGAQGARAGARA